MALDLHTHVRTASARFGEVLAGTDPSARVPTCPDWTAADLLWHLAEVQWFWAAIVGERLTDPEAAEAVKPERPADVPSTLASLHAATEALLSALDGATDGESIWTWSDDHTVGFVRRFQAHEATMHRLDAELTAGADTGLDPDLAADGVDVVLRHSFCWHPDWAELSAGPIGRVGAGATSVLVQVGGWGGHSPDTGKDYADQPMLTVVDAGDPAFSLSGDPVVLDRWLWSRGPADGLHVEGDRAAYEKFAAVVAAGVQ